MDRVNNKGKFQVEAKVPKLENWGIRTLINLNIVLLY